MSSETNTKKSRSKRIWIEVDTGEKNAREYFNDLLEKEACLNSVKSSKTYARCKHHDQFNCKWSARKFEVKGTGECKVEI